MSKDTLKNRVRFSSTLSLEADKKLKEFCKSSMIPISRVIELAVLEYIKKKQS